MDRRIAGYSLVELAISVALLAILAIPIGGLAFEYVQASLEADTAIAAENLARNEQERTVLIPVGSLSNWCSADRVDLPPSESWCPATVSGPNPYAGLPYDVTRRFQVQTPTDGSGGNRLRRLTVRVFLRGQATPLVNVVSYRVNNVEFGPSHVPPP